MVLREAPCPSTRLTLAASIIYKKTHLHEPTTPPPISRGAGTIGGCGGAIDCADAFAVGQQLQSACVPHAGRRAPANDVTLSPVRHDAWASRIAVSALLAVHAHVAKDAREKSRTLSQSNCVPPYPPRSVSESHVTKSCRTISVRDSFQCVRILTSASMACCLRVKQTSGKLSLTRLPGRQSKRTRRTPAVVRRGSAAPRTAQTLATMTVAASGQASDTASGNDPPGTHHSSSRSSLRKRRSHRRRGTSRRHSQHLPTHDNCTKSTPNHHVVLCSSRVMRANLPVSSPFWEPSVQPMSVGIGVGTGAGTALGAADCDGAADGASVVIAA